MNSRQVISIYRAMAILIVVSPIVLNVVLVGDFVMSLLYAPLVSLTLAVIAVTIDSKLAKAMASQNSKVTQKNCCNARFIQVLTHTTDKHLSKAA